MARALGAFDVSTLKEPYRVKGKKTMAYELWEQLEGALPEFFCSPNGGGDRPLSHEEGVRGETWPSAGPSRACGAPLRCIRGVSRSSTPFIFRLHSMFLPP